MVNNKFLKNLSPNQKELSSRIFNLVLNRVLRKAYTSFDKETKEEMEEVFNLEDNTKKDKFIKENISDYKKLIEEEMKKIEDDIKAEIERRI